MTDQEYSRKCQRHKQLTQQMLRDGGLSRSSQREMARIQEEVRDALLQAGALRDGDVPFQTDLLQMNATPEPPKPQKPVFGQDHEPTRQRALFIGADDLPGQQYLIDPFTQE
jgi:hypothetical protein